MLAVAAQVAPISVWRAAAPPAGWRLVARGVRRGTLWRATASPASGDELYLPPVGSDGPSHRLVVVASGDPAATSERLGLPDTADALIWDGATPAFAVLLTAGGDAASSAPLPFQPQREVELGAPASAGALQSQLERELTPAGARRAAAAADGILPAGWRRLVTGPAGGTLWQGSIPNDVVSDARRESLVYLPPDVSTRRRYPVVYLLHGLRGSPGSYVGGLRLGVVADDLIRRHAVPPFIAVMPPAGRSASYDGEWTGPWDRFVVRDVVPWARRKLPVERTAAGSTVAGLSAGGYGSLDIGLRRPGLFGTLECWSGSFRAPHDGSLTGATHAQLDANDPTLLVRQEARQLRTLGTRIFLSAGLTERKTLAVTRTYAGLLARLRIPHELVLADGGHWPRTWRAQLPFALVYALRR